MKRTSDFLKLSIFFSFMAGTVFLFAQELKAANPYIVCSKSLVALKEQGHSMPGLSRELTEASTKFLAAFRDSRLPASELDYQPQSQQVSANDSSSKRTQQAVASRLTALLKESCGDIKLGEGSEAEREYFLRWLGYRRNRKRWSE